MSESATTPATDPVCGMTVDPDKARPAGLVTEHDGKEYYFCGKGCLLEFRDDPEHYVDPSYVPSM
jgi:YHS domain-containing protein